MARDTKPNFSCEKFEQCATDVMNLSGCTQIYGTFDLESGSTLTICDGYELRKVLTSDMSGVATWEDIVTENGLTNIDNKINLGGDLVRETTISLNASSLNFFNPGVKFDYENSFDNVASSILNQTDGKLLFGGSFCTYSGETVNEVVRLNSDGSRDTTFNACSFDGYYSGFAKPSVYSMFLQPDDKIVVAGNFCCYDGVCSPGIVRINSDGSRDTSFNTGTAGFNNYTFKILPQGDNKILVSGQFTQYSGNTAAYFARLCSDGSFDPTLNQGTGFNACTRDIALQSDGKILVSGYFSSYSGNSSCAIVRLCENGTYDSTFVNHGFSGGASGLSTSFVDKINLDSNECLVVGGNFTAYSGISKNFIIRLKPDGDIDTTFVVGTGFAGSGYQNGRVQTLAIQPDDGKIIAGGLFETYQGSPSNSIIRLNTDGSIDSSFVVATGFTMTGTSGAQARVFNIQENSKVLVGGVFTAYDDVMAIGFIRLNSDGSPNTDDVDHTIYFDGTDAKYGEDYSSTYTNRSLVDKEYVDNIIATGTTNVSGENVTKEITQSSHGFAVNDFIGWSGGTYNKAIADGTYDGEFVGIVTVSADTNTFSVTQSGYVSGLTASFTANTTYWLSESTAGLLTSTEPTGESEISKAAFFADTTSSGWVLPYVGVVVSTGATSISTANNGLTDNGGIVQLGGTLCQNTNIDVSTYSLSICNLSGKTTQNNAIFIDSATGTLVTGVTTAGCGLYSSNSPATCTVGGITAGATLTGQTLEYLLQEILAPYIEPTFSSFAVNITPQPIEVGTAVSGTKTFTWGTTTSGNVASNSIGILNVTSGTTIATGLSNDGTEALGIGTLTNAAPQTWTFRITGCSTQDNSFQKDVSKCSIYPYFWGVETCGSCPTIDNTMVNAGTKVVSSVGTSVSVTFNSSSQWTWFAMPTVCAARTKWFVAVGNCGFIDRACASDKYPNSCTLDITDAGGCWNTVSYKVYMSGFAATDGEPIAFRTY